jgi:hypothetical protein
VVLVEKLAYIATLLKATLNYVQWLPSAVLMRGVLKRWSVNFSLVISEVVGILWFLVSTRALGARRS